MPRPWPQPPPRKTTSPAAVAAGIAAPPDGGHRPQRRPEPRAARRPRPARRPRAASRRAAPGHRTGAARGTGGAGGTAPVHDRGRSPTSGAFVLVLGLRNSRNAHSTGPLGLAGDAPPVLRHLRRWGAPPGRRPARRPAGPRRHRAGVQRAPRPVDRRPGLDAPPSLDPAAAGLAAAGLLERAWPSARSAGARTAAGRTRWSSATSATSTCCWPGGCSRTCRSSSTTWSAPATPPPTAACRVVCGSGCCAGWTRRRWAAADVVVVDTDEHRDALPGCPPRPRTGGRRSGAPESWYAGHDATSLLTDAARAGRCVRCSSASSLRCRVRRSSVGSGRLAGAPVLVTMIGHGQDLAATRAARGGEPAGDLATLGRGCRPPGIVAGHDVCLGIFGDGAKARRVVPNKVFQGMAAGCAIVTSDTPPQRRLLGDSAVLVPAGDADALAGALLALAEDRAQLQAALRTTYERAVADSSRPRPSSHRCEKVAL